MIALEGLAISGYRSFGESVQQIAPFSKVNLFAGKNNSGKSNILRLIHQHLVGTSPGTGLKEIDRLRDAHKSQQDPNLIFGLALKSDSPRIHQFQEKMRNATEREWFNKILVATADPDNSKMFWIQYVCPRLDESIRVDRNYATEVRNRAGLSQQAWEQINALLNRPVGVHDTVEWVEKILVSISPWDGLQHGAIFVPAVREVSAAPTTPKDYSGAGIIDKLAKLQNPDVNSRQLAKDFQTINDFLKEVTGDDEAEIEIPYERDEILVHMNKKTLSLESLGTGIHEAIILASAATIVKKKLICIEEPEIHLHPELQRRLLRYLSTSTDNQYFITTHSAHILDTPDASVFHVQLKDGQSCVKQAFSPSERAFVARDLGFRATDIVQANAIVWVEGPSDRIYLNHWIRCVDPTLIEGLHYSVMFYGGRLLSHLTANDPDIEQFISLPRINRNMVIVMDSDRKSLHDRINDTKQRVRGEFEKLEDGFAWVTKGREIENYIESQILTAAYETINSTCVLKDKGQFDKVTQYKRKNSRKSYNVDKIRLAQEVANMDAELDVLDLRKMIKRLVIFIQKVNAET